MASAKKTEVLFSVKSYLVKFKLRMTHLWALNTITTTKTNQPTKKLEFWLFMLVLVATGEFKDEMKLISLEFECLSIHSVCLCVFVCVCV